MMADNRGHRLLSTRKKRRVPRYD